VAARIGQVTVARLDPGDVAENDAALGWPRAGAGAGGAGLMLDPAFTGRVNIRATGPGVVALDAGAIARLNAVDPMITLATVPGWQRVVEGTMVGTVKIISYAVDGAALEAACAAGAGALRRVAPVPASRGPDRDGGAGRPRAARREGDRGGRGAACGARRGAGGGADRAP
jgi:molybdenum cofactor cytidylyltransferase